MILNEKNIPKYYLLLNKLYDEVEINTNNKEYYFRKGRNALKICFYDSDENKRAFVILFEHELCGFKQIADANTINTISDLELLSHLLLKIN